MPLAPYSAVEHVDTGGESIGDLRRGHQPDPRGGQFDRERNAVEVARHRSNACLVVRVQLETVLASSGAVDEELDPGGLDVER